MMALLAIGGIATLSIMKAHETGLSPDDEGAGLSPDETERAGAGNDAEKTGVERVEEDHRILGQVILPNGEPVANALVRVSRSGDDELRETRTDRAGRFHFIDLPIDFYAVESEHPDYGPAYVIGVVPGGAIVRLVLQTGKELKGQITQHGKTVAGGTVHIGGPGFFPQRSQAIAANGSFRIGGLRLGHYQVIAVAPGLSSGFVEDVFLDSDTTAPLALDMRPAPVVRLQLNGKRDRQPIESGVVTISQRSVYTLAVSAPIHDGEAVIDFLPPGEYWIRVRAPGYMPHEGRFWVTREGGEVPLTLKQGATLVGKVVDQANNPIQGVRLRAVIETPSGADYEMRNGIFEVFHRLSRPDGTPFWWPSSDYTTNAKGRFSISGIPHGLVTVTAQHNDYAISASRELRVQSDERYEDIQIVMQHGVHVRGRVESAQGGALQGALVSITSSSLPAWLTDTSLVTDHTGSFHVSNLPQKVRIKVRHPDYGAVSHEFDLGENGLDDLVIRMETPDLNEYSGRVLTTQKGPAKGAHVWLMTGNSTVPTCTAISDTKGHFSSNNCTTKPDQIIIWLNGYAPLREEITNPSDAKDWVLRAGGELAVVSQRQPLHVEVEAQFFAPPQARLHRELSLDRWQRELLKQLTPGDYHVSCSQDQYVTATQTVRVQEGKRTEVVCPQLNRIASKTIVVVDAAGAPVAGAEVWFDSHAGSQRMTSNSKGRIDLTGDPGKWVRVTASHSGWGQGSSAFQFASEPTEPLQVILNEPIGGKDQAAFIANLTDWGVDVVPDNMSLIIEHTHRESAAGNVGIRRGDELLWAREHGSSRLSVGVRRKGHVVVFDLVKDAP